MKCVSKKQIPVEIPQCLKFDPSDEALPLCRDSPEVVMTPSSRFAKPKSYSIARNFGTNGVKAVACCSAVMLRLVDLGQR
jgi:hypothetical protein